MQQDKRQSSGEVIIEAAIIMPLCLALLFVMIVIGQVLYRQMMVTVAANEAAYNVAMVYRDLNRDPMMGYTSTNEVALQKPYRYFFWNKSRYEGTNRAKAEWYATSIIVGSSLYSGEAMPDVNVRIDEGSLFNLRRRIVVDISEDYRLPAGGFLQVFGVDSTIQITASASADCVDMIDYMNSVSYFRELEEMLEEDTVLSDAIQMIKDWAEVISGED